MKKIKIVSFLAFIIIWFSLRFFSGLGEDSETILKRSNIQKYRVNNTKDWVRIVNDVPLNIFTGREKFDRSGKSRHQCGIDFKGAESKLQVNIHKDDEGYYFGIRSGFFLLVQDFRFRSPDLIHFFEKEGVWKKCGL